MSGYAAVERVVIQVRDAAAAMSARDERLTSFANDVAGEMGQLERDLMGAPNEPTGQLDRNLLERSVDSLIELADDLATVEVPQNRTGVGADQAYEVLGKYRPHIRNIQEVLRRK